MSWLRQLLYRACPRQTGHKGQQVPPVAFKGCFRHGKAIVIEFVNGKAKIFDSAGVITNNPTYDWHITNLQNYVGLQTKNHEDVKFMKTKYEKLSNGTGGIGLPGDFTSTSRFIRAMYLLNATVTNNKIKTNEEAILRAFRILNQFDIPEGSVVETKPHDQDKVTTMEATSWTSMADLSKRRYYYNTLNSRSIRMIDLGELIKKIPESTKPVTIDVPASETIINVTDQFKVK
jgi:choloylglycine hydrolase